MGKAMLTQALVDKCAPVSAGARKYKIADAAIAGFHLVVFASGKKTYYLRYTDPRGRQQEVKIGHHGDITAAQARKSAVELRAKITLGGDPAGERRHNRSFVTVGAFVAERYLPYIVDSLRSYTDYEAMCRLRIVPAFGRMAIDEVTVADVAAFRRRLIAEKLSNARTNRCLAVLRRIFNLAIQWGCLSGRNPAQSPGMLREEPRVRSLTAQQLRALMTALGEDDNRVAASAVALMALTGARKSEVTKAEWSWVDFEQRVLIVPRSKSGRSRPVYLPDRALDLLRLQPRVPGQVHVFPSSRCPGKSIEGVRGVWLRAKEAAGLPSDLRPHDLRHAFASFAINNGTSLYEVGRLLGHSQVATTSRYAHLSADTLHKAANAVGLIVADKAA